MGKVKEHYFEEINSRETAEDYDYQYYEWLKQEEWRDVPGYGGQYQVSNRGNVKTLSDRWGKERLLKPIISTTGYYFLNLTKDGKSKIYYIHKLVAMCFLNHKADRYNEVVDHINNDKLDNRLENLQLTTNRHNTSKDKTGYTSKYVGVSWNKQTNKWRCQIIINGKRIHLGRFKCEMHAGVTYQKALRDINLFDGDAKKFRNYLQNEK